jgi:hypothetical protein
VANGRDHERATLFHKKPAFKQPLKLFRNFEPKPRICHKPTVSPLQSISTAFSGRWDSIDQPALRNAWLLKPRSTPADLTRDRKNVPQGRQALTGN